MFLETERLMLRRFETADFAAFCRCREDEEMCRMMGWPALTDSAAAQRVFARLKDETPRAYALVLRQTGELVGLLTVCAPSERLCARRELAGLNGCELSFGVFADYRREGFAYEAVCHVIERLFLIEGRDYVSCASFGCDRPALALQKKLGFMRMLSERVELNGKPVDRIESVLSRT